MEKSLYFLLRLRLGDEGVSVGSGDTRLWMFGWSSTMDGEDNQTWMTTCFTRISHCVFARIGSQGGRRILANKLPAT